MPTPSLWFFLFLFQGRVNFYRISHDDKCDFAKVSKERFVENANVPEIVSSGTYNFCEKSSILIFQATAIFT